MMGISEVMREELEREVNRTINECASKIQRFIDSTDFSPPCVYVALNLIAKSYANNHLEKDEREFWDEIVRNAEAITIKIPKRRNEEK